MRDGVMESASALRRFKVQNGFSVTNKNSASGYTTMCRLRRIIQKEFTPAMYRRYVASARRRPYQFLSHVDRIDRFCDKTDKLDNEILVELEAMYKKDGILALIGALDRPFANVEEN